MKLMPPCLFSSFKIEVSKSVPARQVSGGPFLGKEFRKTQIFVCSSSAGLKSGKRNRPPLRKKEPHAALRPPYPPKGIKIVKTSTPSAVPRKSTRERRRKGGARARARCRGCKHARTIPPFERHRSASRSPGVRIVCELRRPVGERL